MILKYERSLGFVMHACSMHIAHGMLQLCSYGQSFVYFWLRWHFTELTTFVILRICIIMMNLVVNIFGLFSLFQWNILLHQKMITMKLERCLCLTHHSYEILWKFHSRLSVTNSNLLYMQILAQMVMCTQINFEP